MRYVYILLCKDNTLYTGITTDLVRRLSEHNSGSKGSKYTSARRPNVLLRCQKFNNRSEATKQELKIKKLSKSQKLKLTNN